jgi:hypothetical protein
MKPKQLALWPVFALVFAIFFGWASLTPAALTARAAPPAQATAQPDNLPPSIIFFTADLTSVSFAQLETNPPQAVLSWGIVGMSQRDRIVLEYFRIADWVVLSNDPALLTPNMIGARVSVTPTLDFAPPMFRLSVRNANNAIITQQIVVIPYQADQQGILPSIEAFTATTSTVNFAQLANNSARINIGWRVINRWTTTNLVFEQIFADGSKRSAELPRVSRWISSAGEGLVLPTLRANDDAVVTIRLSLVDLRTGQVQAQREIVFPIDRGRALQPTSPVIATAGP